MLFVFPPSDPAGFIYCEETGEIITGGTIEVTTPPGGSILINDDGSSGRYSWIVTGSPVTEGLYTMTYNSPTGYSNTGIPGDRVCLLYTSPSPRDATLSRMPSSA